MPSVKVISPIYCPHSSVGLSPINSPIPFKSDSLFDLSSLPMLSLNLLLNRNGLNNKGHLPPSMTFPTLLLPSATVMPPALFLLVPVPTSQPWTTFFLPPQLPLSNSYSQQNLSPSLRLDHCSDHPSTSTPIPAHPSLNMPFTGLTSQPPGKHITSSVPLPTH